MMGIPADLQKLVREREQHRCAYCRTPEFLTVTVFEIDHIIPKHSGGEAKMENLCLACPSCNRYKGAGLTSVDPETGEEIRLFHPRRDRWDEHFAWEEDQTRIVGLTAIGRATIEKLRMNRPQMVRLRALWRRLGIDLSK
jgi:hypothetical protein